MAKFEDKSCWIYQHCLIPFLTGRFSQLYKDKQPIDDFEYLKSEFTEEFRLLSNTFF